MSNFVILLHITYWLSTQTIEFMDLTTIFIIEAIEWPKPSTIVVGVTCKWVPIFEAIGALIPLPTQVDV